MQQLNCNPCSEKIDTEELNDIFIANIQDLRHNEEQKLLKTLKKQDHNDETLDEVQDLFREAEASDNPEAAIEKIQEDLFGYEDINLEGSENEIDDLFEDADSIFDEDPELESLFEHFEQIEKQQELELSRLLKATSINKLSRRVARALHPDLEQDPNLKREKHEKMSELVQARDTKDIATIIRIYTETLGTLPDDFPSTDYPKLTATINRQIEKLREEKQEILHENPFYADIFEMFGVKNESRKIHEYIRATEKYAREIRKTTDNITSIKTLRQHIENRLMSLDFLYEREDEFF